jgi:hypothetical protein
MKGRRDRILKKKEKKKVGSNTHSKVYVKKNLISGSLLQLATVKIIR